ncbi:hypothetical protein L345_03645, partial [Ophiophagus hannah]
MPFMYNFRIRSEPRTIFFTRSGGSGSREEPSCRSTPGSRSAVDTYAIYDEVGSERKSSTKPRKILVSVQQCMEPLSLYKNQPPNTRTFKYFGTSSVKLLAALQFCSKQL